MGSAIREKRIREGRVAAGNKKERGLFSLEICKQIFALISLIYARLVGAKCISRKSVGERKKRFSAVFGVFSGKKGFSAVKKRFFPRTSYPGLMHPLSECVLKTQNAFSVFGDGHSYSGGGRPATAAI